MSFVRNAFCALMLLAVVPAHADQAAAAKLATLLGQAGTITGQFSQLTLDGSGTQLQETSGQMSLKRPGQLRWHTDAPMEQLLVSNGTTVWLYDPDLEQVTVQKMDQRLTHTPALLLSGDVSKISESFDITLSEAGQVADFVLTPKARDTLFDTLRMSFRGGVINDMQLIDGVGQRTNILFTGIKMNEPLAQSLFNFVPPAGADVIQE